jgi:hypothetical protein
MISRYGTGVRIGPFAGLILPEKCVLACCNTAALVGTYEAEIQPWLHKLRPYAYQRILDIGAAEGYYAVGMAVRTGCLVDAFDPAFAARRLCRSMAKLNGVSRLVRVHSWCSQKTLLQLDGLRCFILSDCEGYEVPLFSEEVIRALANSDLIIELHDGDRPAGATRKLLEARFGSTHDVQVVRFQPRSLSQFPESALEDTLGRDAIRAISEEGRSPDQEWLIATPYRKPLERGREVV